MEKASQSQPSKNEQGNVTFDCMDEVHVKDSPKKEHSANPLPLHDSFDYSSNSASSEEKSNDLAHNSMFLQTLNLKSKGVSDGYSVPHIEDNGIAHDNHDYKQETVTTILDSSGSLERFSYNTNMMHPVEAAHDPAYPNFLIPKPPEASSDFKSNTVIESDNQNSLGKTLATSLHLIAATDAHTDPPPVESFLPDSVGMDELRSSTSTVVPSGPNSNDSVTSTTPETEGTPSSIRYRTRSIAVSEKNSSVNDDSFCQNGSCMETKEERITSTDDEPFHRCDQCGKVFHKKQTLRQHYITHTDRFACTFCNVRCKSKGDLRSHTQTHTKEKPFHCEVCNTHYTRESILKKHKTTQLHKTACIKAERMHLLKRQSKKPTTDHSAHAYRPNASKKGKRTCQQCAKVFSSQQELVTHSKLHTYAFVCSKCHKKCKSAELLSIHERGHTRSTTLVCRFCSRLFSSTAVLKEHIKGHYRGSGRYLNCKRSEICFAPPKEPSTQSPLEIESNASSSQKAQTARPGKRAKKQEILFCQMCPRQFKSPKAFEKHCAKHLRKSPEELQVEEKRDNDQESKDFADEGSKLYSCTDCALTFDTLENLKSHRREIHNLQTMACNICNREFEDSSEYKNHVQNHAPTMLFSGESLEDSKITVVSRKTTKRLNINNNNNKANLPDVSSHDMQTPLNNTKTSHNVKADNNVECECDYGLDCYDFIRLSKAVAAESSNEEETDDRDTGDESSDDQLYKGIQTLLCLNAGDSGDEDIVDMSSTARSILRDQSKIDYQSFLDNHTTQDVENHSYRCLPCNACFAENGQLIDHIKTHACDICFECFVDKKSLLEHRSQHELDYSKDTRRTYGFASFDEASSTSEDEANDLFLDELESVLDCEAKSAPQIDILHKFGHDEIVKANKRIFERYSCIDTPTNIYACTICKRKYARPTTLTRHFKTHVCHYCNKFFIDKSDLLEHKYKHRQKAALLRAEISGEQSAKLLNSPVVSKVNRELIKKFTFIDSSRNVNKCCLCDKSFVRKTVLTRHMKTHICSYCDKFYEDKYELARHVGMHKIDARVSEDGGEGREYADFDEEKPYSSRPSLTDQLGADGKVVALGATFSSSLPHFSTFANPAGDAHETLTFIEIPVSDNCGNTSNVAFGNSNEAVTSTYQIISDSIDAFKETAHESFIVDGSGCPPDDSNKIITIGPNQMVAADGNQDRLNLFECTLCGKTFFKSGHLKSHMSTHTVRKPHICHLCGKSFVRRGALKRHEKSHDVKRCKFCDTSFNYQFELDDHMQMHESYPF